MNTLEKRNELVERFKPLIAPLAWRLKRGTGLSIQDLISEGYLGLIKACGTLDETRSTMEQRAYISRAAIRAMQDFIRKEAHLGLVDVPVDVKINPAPVAALDSVPIDMQYYDDSLRHRILKLPGGPLRATLLCILQAPYTTKTAIAKALTQAFGKEYTKNDVDRFIQEGRVKIGRLK